MSNATPPINAPQGSSGNVFSTLGIIFGAVSLLFIPIVFGVAGLVLAIISKTKPESRSTLALVISSVGLVGGIVIGALVGASVA